MRTRRRFRLGPESFEKGRAILNGHNQAAGEQRHDFVVFVK